MRRKINGVGKFADYVNNKSVGKQVSVFSKTIMNIFSNFVPNKLVTYDESDPPWINVL